MFNLNCFITTSNFIQFGWEACEKMKPKGFAFCLVTPANVKATGGSHWSRSEKKIGLIDCMYCPTLKCLSCKDWWTAGWKNMTDYTDLYVIHISEILHVYLKKIPFYVHPVHWLYFADSCTKFCFCPGLWETTLCHESTVEVKHHTQNMMSQLDHANLMGHIQVTFHSPIPSPTCTHLIWINCTNDLFAFSLLKNPTIVRHIISKHMLEWCEWVKLNKTC